MLLRPVHVFDGSVDVEERHLHLAPAPLRRLCAEVGQPAVIGTPAGLRELGGCGAGIVVERVELERLTVGEQHLGHHADALELLDPKTRIPLDLRGQLGMQVPGIRYLGFLSQLHLRVISLEVLLLEVVPITGPRRLDVTIDRDDRGSAHGTSSS